MTLAQTKANGDRTLPPGKVVTVNGRPATLVSGLQGAREVRKIVPDESGGGGKTVTVEVSKVEVTKFERGSVDVTVTPAETGAPIGASVAPPPIASFEVSAAPAAGGATTSAAPTAGVELKRFGVKLESVPYTDARRVTWYVSDQRMELLSTIAEEELLKVAASIGPAAASATNAG